MTLSPHLHAAADDHVQAEDRFGRSSCQDLRQLCRVVAAPIHKYIYPYESLWWWRNDAFRRRAKSMHSRDLSVLDSFLSGRKYLRYLSHPLYDRFSKAHGACLHHSLLSCNICGMDAVFKRFEPSVSRPCCGPTLADVFQHFDACQQESRGVRNITRKIRG